MRNTNKPQNIIPLTIGSLARALGITRAMLRIYDKEGILSPERTDKNRRYYTYEDYQKAALILFLTRNLAINLAGVKIIISLLEKNKVKTGNYIEYINSLAKSVRINAQKQEENVLKAKRKGRRKN